MAAPADRDAVDQAVARGSDLLKQGKLDDAQAAFRAALTLDADNPRVLALLGLAHFRGNQYERARAIYEELVERLPTDASYRLNLGLVYLKLGDAAKAIHSLEASRALDPSQGRAVSYLGLAYARAGRYVEAYRAFLLAGQTELASEIELNLTPAERDGIHTTLARTGFDPRRSSPAIVLTGVTPPAGVPLQSSPAIVISPPMRADDASAPRLSESQMFVLPNRDPNAARLTDSQQFVSPFKAVAPAVPSPGQSAISQAVEIAAPVVARLHGNGPIPLSQLATEDLARPDDGTEPFELAPGGALVIRVVERVMTRLDGVHVTGGDLSFERATRHSRGRQTDEKFDYGGSQLHVVTGEGYLIAVPDKRAFTAVSLDDDIFYLREDLVFAF
ncbi:MAG TPA: tetratricopeptide repeat protein, partial [Kofleriaceae bacterium]|nr:tetratricopeptide repeat protein [Kofleriaceae bacterium]